MADCGASKQEALEHFSDSTPNIQQAPGLMLDIIREGMLQKWYQPCQHSIWSDAMVSEMIKHLQLVQKQQVQLLSGIHIKHFGLVNQSR